MKSINVRRILNYSPVVYGLVYFGLVPIFALIYYILPSSNFKTDLDIDNFLTCLYYSTATITTVGFGDISPIGGFAQLIAIMETLLGLVLIGLFLNSLAHLKSEIDVKEERIKNEAKIFCQEVIRFNRHNKIIQSNIEYYLLYTAIITKPMTSRPTYTLNRNFTFNDMSDLFAPSMLPTDPFFVPAVEFYFRHQKNLENSIHEMLVNIDFSYWPELEQLCFSFLDTAKKLDYRDSILEQTKIRLGDMKGSEDDARLIRNHEGEIKFYPSNSINKYISLYQLIKKNLNFIDNYQKKIQEINRL